MRSDFSHDDMDLLAQCPSCQTRYKQDDARLVQRKGLESIFHVSCWSCRSALMISVKKRPGGIICAGIITDCEFDDAKKFSGAERITVDDVIRVHKALELDNLIEIR
ncbi:MAG: hypothetical protein ABH846_01650 [Patescibacteria group bacterium]